MKKLIIAGFVLVSASLTWANFYDVSENHEYQEAISYLQSQNIVQGYQDGTFRPEQTINRVEFLKIVLEAQLPNATSCNTNFNYSDVEASAWYARFVQTASCLGIVEGYPDGTFGTTNTINYAEAAKIVSEVFKLSVTTGDLWYSGYLAALAEANAQPRRNIQPADPLTRGEMAQIIYQLRPPAMGQIPDDSNVLMIILDDVGLDYFPGYLENEGFDKAPMPFVEKLMDYSYVFNHFQVYSMCSPTRASLLTGLHGVDNGVLDPGRTSYLDPKFKSLQQELKAFNPNIATSVFGKWHIIGNKTDDLSHPNQFGIDEYAGLMSGSHESYFNWNKIENQTQTTSDVYSTTEFTNDAIDFIQAQDGQWFTWLAYTAPHTPIHLPPAELHSFDNLTGEGQDLRRNKNEYLKAMLQSVDTEIGRLLNSMDTETRSKTWVIIMGDNGTGSQVSQDPFKSVGAKGTLQVGGINTPLVVYNPYQNGGGKRFDDLVSTIDFYPTITNIMTGQNISTKGRSFYPLVSGNTSAYQGHEYVFSQHLSAVTVRSATYKLIDHDEDGEKFYDLANDFYEEQNLIDRLNTSQAQAYTQLRKALDDYRQGNYGQSRTYNSDNTSLNTTTEEAIPETTASIYLGNYTLTDAEFGTNTVVTISGNTRSINTNSLPNHDTGTFPGPGNPNAISAQSTPYNFPLNPVMSSAREARHPGVGINGIPFAPGTAERVNCESGEEYHVEGFQSLVNLGLDQSNAHVQPTGQYHYHGVPTGLIEFADNGEDLVHIGFARDGHLMYYSQSGAYTPSYQLSDNTRSGSSCVVSGPRGTAIELEGTQPNGMFSEDWNYVAGLGNLDECNGGLINGEYAYLVTESYPYVGRCLNGEFEEAARGGGQAPR